MTLLINRLFNSKYRHIKKKIQIQIQKKPSFAAGQSSALGLEYELVDYFTNLEVWREPSV